MIDLAEQLFDLLHAIGELALVAVGATVSFIAAAFAGHESDPHEEAWL